MEKTRRKSSASEFFSRRNSSGIFRSMRRYSTSTMFGARPVPDPDTCDQSENSDTVSDKKTKKKGRRHSSTQLPISNSNNFGSDKLKIFAIAAVLGDVEEHQENDQILEKSESEGILSWLGSIEKNMRTIS